MKDKKPFKETAVGKWLAGNAPDILDTVDDFFPPVKVITELLKGKKLTPDQQAQFEAAVRAHEIEMEKLSISDKSDARNREIETVKAGRRYDVLMLLTGVIILGLAILTVVAIFFLDLKNKELSHFIAGEIIGMSLGTMVTYYFGSSRSSQDKDRIIRELRR